MKGTSRIILLSTAFFPSLVKAKGQGEFFGDQTGLSCLFLLLALVFIVLEFFVNFKKAALFISVIFFLLYFYTKAGLENENLYLSGAIFLVGLILISVEFFLAGFGLAGISGIIILLFGAYFARRRPEIAFETFATALVMVFCLDFSFIKSGLMESFRNKYVLKEEEQGDFESDKFIDLMGKEGLSTTILRPSGMVKIEGKIYPAISRSSFIEKGEKIRVIEIVGNKIIVEKV